MSFLIQKIADLNLKERLRNFEGFVVQRFRAVRELDRFYLKSDVRNPPGALADSDPRTRAEGLRFLLGVDSTESHTGTRT